ncbi:MAG: NUDIX hydrolase [Leptospiraceae bacterium]|nr:NUDIX hydrolase [Leptospiraceae bacterium]MCP5497509.1 NUDIX hydrolase [Leptospiraceae bacterium]
MEKSWVITDKKKVYSNKIFDVVSFCSTSPNKNISAEFYVLETNEWVNVIPITPEGMVILVKQHRHGINQESLELPGGVVKHTGETRLLDSAKAELREETGFTSDNWTYQGKVSANPAILNNWSYAFVAENVVKTHPLELDPEEDIETIEVHIHQLPKLIQSGQIHHSIMVAAIGCFFMNKEK